MSKNNKNNTVLHVNPVMAAVAGAVVGAGVAVAGAIVMSDEKNQDKVKEVLANAQDKKEEIKDNVKVVLANAQDKKEQLKENVIKGVEKV